MNPMLFLLKENNERGCYKAHKKVDKPIIVKNSPENLFIVEPEEKEVLPEKMKFVEVDVKNEKTSKIFVQDNESNKLFCNQSSCKGATDFLDMGPNFKDQQRVVERLQKVLDLIPIKIKKNALIHS